MMMLKDNREDSSSIDTASTTAYCWQDDLVQEVQSILLLDPPTAASVARKFRKTKMLAAAF
jgi:hypothetical protein